MVFDRLLKSINGGDVLDVGCGSGQFIRILAGSLGSYRTITGVDVEDESLSEARTEFRDEGFRFLKIDPGPLPFGDGAYDMAVISKALHHVEDAQATLEDMKRVLKQGGYILINEMHRDQLNPAQESHMLYHHLRADIDNLLGISHHHTFHREELFSLAELLNLEERVILEFDPEGPAPKDADNIREFIDKMEGWMKSLNGHPEIGNIRTRVESLKVRFREHGISRPPQMVILGRK